MAQRRMFSKKVTNTDPFLDMPLSAQCLYFHLNMEADDDGFIGNAKTIRRMIGASEDDLKLLLAKEFVIPFDSGVVVIKDWKIHNYIRKDRYNETIYKAEKSTLITNENEQYELGMTNGRPMVDQWLPQVRLGKDRLDKDIGQPSNQEKPKEEKTSSAKLTEDFEKLWTLYPNKQGKKKAFTAYQRAIKGGATNKQVQDGIVAYKKHLAANDWLKPAHGSTWFTNERWNDEHSDVGTVGKKVDNAWERQVEELM